MKYLLWIAVLLGPPASGRNHDPYVTSTEADARLRTLTDRGIENHSFHASQIN